MNFGGPELDADDVEDLEEAPENEVEVAEEEILDQATAEATVAELKMEIGTLTGLESLAAHVRHGGHDAMDSSRVARVREERERAEARRLQPHYIESFFLEAFRRLGGAPRQREPRRYEITNVPAPIRNRDRQIGAGDPVLPRYERITFEKELISLVNTLA
jgi:chorismate mutase